MDIRGLFDKDYLKWVFSSKYKKLLWQIKACQEDQRTLHLSNGVVLDFEGSGIRKDVLEKALHELKEMYEGTRKHGAKGRQYWGTWLCDNAWFFGVIEILLEKELDSMTGGDQDG